jgi:DNA-binding NarL/FixJ family response regulator
MSISSARSGGINPGQSQLLAEKKWGTNKQSGRMKMIKVAIIDDHKVLVEALAVLIASYDDMVYAGGASTVQSGFEMMAENRPDVLLLDVDLPDGNGLEMIPEIIKKYPGMYIVVLTCLTDEYTLMKAIDMGVSGFLPKGSSLNELVTTIRKTAGGEIVMPPSLLVGLLKRLPRDRSVMPHRDNPWEHLTQREQEILNYLAKGNSGIEIARRLSIAPLTVRTHIRNLMGKLGVHSRLEAVAFGIKHGLVETRMHQQ